MNSLLHLLVLALAFVLGGCISISAPSVPRPAEWGAVQKTEGECPLVAGSYQDKGEGPGAAALSLDLLKMGQQYMDTVTITGPSEGIITVEASRQGHVITAIEFPKKTFSMSPPYYKCDGDTVELRTYYDEQRHGGANFNTKTENVVLQKATDGHLIVMHEEVASSSASVPQLFLFWYSYKKSKTWFRFEPITPSGSSSVQPVSRREVDAFEEFLAPPAAPATFKNINCVKDAGTGDFLFGGFAGWFAEDTLLVSQESIEYTSTNKDKTFAIPVSQIHYVQNDKANVRLVVAYTGPDGNKEIGCHGNPFKGNPQKTFDEMETAIRYVIMNRPRGSQEK